MQRTEALYFNSRDETVVEFFSSAKTSVVESVSGELAKVPFESVRPIRASASWPGKRNYEGDYWSATMRSHVHFESLLEREYAMEADFDVSVTAFQWQPMVMKWPRRTKGQRGHVPDYFCRLANGDGLVVDVKRPDKVLEHEEQFRLTREVCDEVGWHYRVFTGIPEPRLKNLTYLCGFRQDRYRAPLDLNDTILNSFSPRVSLRMGVLRAARETGEPTHVVHGWVLHSMWSQALSVNLEELLTDDTLVCVPMPASPGGELS